MKEKFRDEISISERIRKGNDRLGDGGRRMAELVLTHPEEVALSTAAKVAEQLNISEATVVRFAATIGYDGYPALRRALQNQIRRHLNPAQKLDQYAGRHDPESAGAQSFQSDLDDLRATQQSLSPTSVAQAVKLISSARQTYVLGIRSSFVVAFALYHHLNQILPAARLMDSVGGEIFDQLAHLDPRDVLVGISFPRYSKLTVQVMTLASRRGIKTIAITDGPLSPLARNASIVLTAQCSSKAFANSNVAPLALVNALVAEIAVKNRQQSVQSLDRLEDILHSAEALFTDNRAPKAK